MNWTDDEGFYICYPLSPSRYPRSVNVITVRTRDYGNYQWVVGLLGITIAPTYVTLGLERADGVQVHCFEAPSAPKLAKASAS